MIRKGQISTIDLVEQRATVTFKELGGFVTAKIPLMTITIQDIPNYKMNDWVVVAFFGCNFTDGVVLGKIGG